MSSPSKPRQKPFDKLQADDYPAWKSMIFSDTYQHPVYYRSMANPITWRVVWQRVRSKP